jgi:hypothetical protein
LNTFSAFPGYGEHWGGGRCRQRTRQRQVAAAQQQTDSTGIPSPISVDDDGTEFILGALDMEGIIWAVHGQMDSAWNWLVTMGDGWMDKGWNGWNGWHGRKSSGDADEMGNDDDGMT